MKHKFNLFHLTAVIFLLAVAINFLWEVLQLNLYACGTLPFGEIIPKIITATLSDGLIIVAFFFIVSFVNKNYNWVFKMQRNDYLLIVLLGIIFSVSFEYANVFILERWLYSSLMPIVPVINIGLSPILQLVITPILAFWVLSWIRKV